MQLVLLVLLKLFLLGQSQHEHLPPGIVNKQRRIIGGNVVTVKNFPYMAGLVIKWKPLQEDFFAGGAAIISDYWAVTAAHCVLEIKRTNFIQQGKVFVRGNTTYWSGLPGEYFQNHKIIKALTHDLYDEQVDDYDVAVVKVAEKFGGVYEKPIQLADPHYLYKPGTETSVLGWGTTIANVDPYTVPDLRAVIVKLVDHQQCVRSYSTISETITPRMTCAGERGKDACVNDSGGPLADGNILVGIVSWGVECANDNYPGVYTNIGTVSNWIQETMKKQ